MTTCLSCRHFDGMEPMGACSYNGCEPMPPDAEVCDEYVRWSPLRERKAEQDEIWERADMDLDVIRGK